MPQPKPRPKKLNEGKRRFQHSKLSSLKYWSYLQHTVRVLNRLKGHPKQQTILGSPLLYLLKTVSKCTQLKAIAVLRTACSLNLKQDYCFLV